MSVVDKLLAFNEDVQKIARDDRLSWRCRYDLVFSDEMAQKRHSLIPHFDWPDPDTTYEEDVRAFADALDAFVHRQE